MQWYEILTVILVTAVVFVLAIVLMKKGLIPSAALQTAATQLDELHATLVADGDISLFDRIVGYAAMAMHAAEQLMKNGTISADERKGTAMGLVTDYAKVDGVEMDAAGLRVADSVIEAQCDLKGHSSAA